jgi:hypothetical protein
MIIAFLILGLVAAQSGAVANMITVFVRAM